MGLRDFLFGPSVPAEDEEARLSEEREPRRYGHLAGRENLAEGLRQAQKDQEQERGDLEEDESSESASRYHVPQRYERAAGRLRRRLSRHADVMPRWWRQRRGLEKYMEKLEKAEGRGEAHGIFRRAKGLSPSPGRFKKLEGKLEKAEKSLYRKYEGGDISRPGYARKQRELERSLRDLRRLSRWR